VVLVSFSRHRWVLRIPSSFSKEEEKKEIYK